MGQKLFPITNCLQTISVIRVVFTQKSCYWKFDCECFMYQVLIWIGTNITISFISPRLINRKDLLHLKHDFIWLIWNFPPLAFLFHWVHKNFIEGAKYSFFSFHFSSLELKRHLWSNMAKQNFKEIPKWNAWEHL